MQRARAFLILGVWVAILPYLGFPLTIKNILFILTGLIFIYFGLLFYKQALKTQKNKSKNFENFSETNPEDAYSKIERNKENDILIDVNLNEK